MSKIEKLCSEGLTFPIKMESPECKKYRESHPNCRGCASEKAMVAKFQASGDLPLDFDWSEATEVKE